MIEFAEIMSRQELRDFFTSISNNNKNKKTQAWEVLSKHKETLITDYHKFEEEQIKQYQLDKEKLLKEKEFWDKKVCDGCGSKLKLVNSDYGSFWGCINFRDISHKHRNFPQKFEEQLKERWSYLKVKIGANWTTDIIRKNNFQNIVNASDLLAFYTDQYLEDLRAKYGFKNSIDSISGYIKAKEASSTEEKEIANHLSSIFTKSSIQTGIRFKLEGQKERVAIIDLIVSNENEVNIVEIKRSVLDLNEEQLKLYHSLVSFILNETRDKRIVRSLFLVYNSDVNYFKPECSYLLYDKIKNAKTQAVVSNYFKASEYINGG